MPGEVFFLLESTTRSFVFGTMKDKDILKTLKVLIKKIEMETDVSQFN